MQAEEANLEAEEGAEEVAWEAAQERAREEAMRARAAASHKSRTSGVEDTLLDVRRFCSHS